MYAAGKESSQRRPCRAFLRKVVERKGPSACTDAEVLQEILHRYRSLGAPDVAFRIFDSVVGLGIPILPVGVDEVGRARRLLDAWPGLSTRDGVHLGVMEAHGVADGLELQPGFRHRGLGSTGRAVSSCAHREPLRLAPRLSIWNHDGAGRRTRSRPRPNTATSGGDQSTSAASSMPRPAMTTFGGSSPGRRKSTP